MGDFLGQIMAVNTLLFRPRTQRFPNTGLNPDTGPDLSHQGVALIKPLLSKVEPAPELPAEGPKCPIKRQRTILGQPGVA